LSVDGIKIHFIKCVVKTELLEVSMLLVTCVVTIFLTTKLVSATDQYSCYNGMNYNGTSCEDIFSNFPETADKSGSYRINDGEWIYCDMIAIAADAANIISTCADIGGGWRRIALINITAGGDCPGE